MTQMLKPAAAALADDLMTELLDAPFAGDQCLRGGVDRSMGVPVFAG